MVRKADDGTWLVAVAAGQGRTPQRGDTVTVHKASGKLERMTLARKVEELVYGAGKITYVFAATPGWPSDDDDC